MKIIVQIGIVFAICLLGEFISGLLPIPFPASVISMILLFLCLITKMLKEEHIKQKVDFLLKNMAFFFIPAGVGIINQFEAIRICVIPFLLICFFTTILTFAATAGTVTLVMDLQKKWGEKKNG